MQSTEELGEEIASLSAHLDAATHRLLQCIRRFDEACGWHEQAAISCAHWLTWRVGWDPATAREKVRVARALGTLPLINEALRTGGLSYAKVRALTRVANPENQAKLLDIAMYATGAQLERLCRGYRTVLESGKVPSAEDRSVRVRQLPGGMVKLELVLEPDEADLILRAVERAREVHAEKAAPAASAVPGPPDQQSAESRRVSAETRWPSPADGVVKLAESFLAGHQVTGNGGERFQVMVHLDQDVFGPDGAWTGTLEDGSRGNAPQGGVRLRPGGRRSRGGGAEHRPPIPQHSARNPPSLDAAGPRLCLPGLYPHEIPARSPHRALAPRRENQPGQPGDALHLMPTSA
jgi:hypothetical protein